MHGGPPSYVAPPKSDVNAVKDDSPYLNYVPPQETKSRGDGFWRGCCAGWCCYCCLDMCF
ncbi:Cysteine-rich transmembrane CYSTM domain containing protein [Trema orientale]|uniref:Cysteine-rich transmembrane CYSTM domain containing protein n=1 Tax=Trema orientale TaxID=63057 RepID=A0A2P5F4I3_TREOI|nr:Cysteine-rich transmembrane CYSTM domain containing protein [Trema orientale]